MDTTYLDELVKLNNNADKIVSEAHKVNKRLRDEYEDMEVAALEKFIDDMRGLGEYAKKFEYWAFYTGITLDYHRNSFDSYAELIVRFYKDGTFALKSNAYRTYPYIYNDKYSNCGKIMTNFGDTYRGATKCVDGWSWEINDSKRFIALNADKIYNRVYDMICERLAEESKRKIEAVRKQNDRLIEDIAQLEN